ncbi:hypothetical protein [Kitasatospora aureofaciens]|nr:hypothetical protein [Kitasatospora aureofaciens]
MAPASRRTAGPEGSSLLPAPCLLLFPSCRPTARAQIPRTANAALRPCWTCQGSLGGGKEGSKLELREKAGPDRLECPQCEQVRAIKDLGPLVLPAPTKRELVAALVSTPDDPWWEDRVLHAKLLPSRGRRCDLLVLVGVK